MTRSKQTELIHDTQRGVAYQCANQPLYYASTYHQQRLGEAVPYDYARVAILTANYSKRNSHNWKAESVRSHSTLVSPRLRLYF